MGGTDRLFVQLGHVKEGMVPGMTATLNALSQLPGNARLREGAAKA